MALLRGKLFAGALFAGALLSSAPAESPEIPEKTGGGGGYVSVNYAMQSREADRKRIETIRREDEEIALAIVSIMTSGVIT
jgi:hypothetical protein